MIVERGFRIYNLSAACQREICSSVKMASLQEICVDPRFVIEGTSRFDLDQGDVGKNLNYEFKLQVGNSHCLDLFLALSGDN